MFFVLFSEISWLICQLAKKLDTVHERENNLLFKLSGFYFALSLEVLFIMLNPKCLHDTNLKDDIISYTGKSDVMYWI